MDINEKSFEETFSKHGDLTPFAEEFSEGDDYLKITLLNLWKHSIKTISCCKGHSYEDYDFVPYISFSISKCNKVFLDTIMNSVYSLKDGVSFEIRYNEFYNFSVFTIYMREGTKEDTLRLINACISINDMVKPNNNILEYINSLTDYSSTRNINYNLEINNKSMYLTIINNEEYKEYNNEDIKSLDSIIDKIEEIPYGIMTCSEESLHKLVDFLKSDNLKKGNIIK